ncbi:hypothetical protein Tco_0842295 [Tanacetum coccineum]|uniref:Reverse transcriptase domain-containing protein n=1 Tax=Tanacetum coccineum TaxID=301880 RepID=A0ABQ5B2P0_9ASTR
MLELLLWDGGRYGSADLGGNPNVESSTNDQTIGSTDANKENATSFAESNQTFESMMNPSSDFSQEEANGTNERMNGWEEPKLTPMKMSFVNAVVSDKPTPNINFRSLVNEERVEDSDFVLPVEAITMAQNMFANSLVGYFVGNSVAFPLVKNYVTNTWGQYGFQKFIKDDDGFFFYKFTSKTGLEQDKVMKVPVWVKMHKVPIVAYYEDGLSIMATQVGKPIMLDAFTSEMCAGPWGRLGFARALIEVSADKELKKEVIMAVPNVEGDKEENNVVKLKNHFDALHDQDESLGDKDIGETSGLNNDIKDAEPDPNSSDSEVEEMIMEPDPRTTKLKGASTSSPNVSNSSQAMHVQIRHKSTNSILYSSFVYAGNLPTVRRHLWAELNVHKHVVKNKPWILMGDFNVALNIADNHSSLSQINSAIIEFKDCVLKIKVMDINSMGLHFTWNQKPKDGDEILKKLDRIMGNIEFIDSFPGAYAIFQPYRISDHSPSVVSKMKSLKKPLRKLVHDQGNLHDRVSKLRVELDEVQKALDLDSDNQILREEEVVYVEAFNVAKLDEERFLKQKAKIEWLDVGDLNSAYFNKAVKSSNQRSRIEVILNSDNIEVSGPSVPDVFVLHYEMFIGSNISCVDLNIDGLFQNKVSRMSYLDMVREISDDEIKIIMFDIGDDRASGPDGFMFAFFKKGWDVIGSDVCKAIREFFTNGCLLKEINHTFIALIPNVPTPIRVNYYRPISCCNVIYKCISKILTNHIIRGIKEVVSENQSAFVPGRRISDNILITQEIMHNYYCNRGPPRINGDIHGYFKGKRGLRQRDPLSPYLFTLVMEVLTLILKIKVSLSKSFRYHKHCEELQLINVFFIDYLFIFARGDVDSARIIMEALDKFKASSGLVSSIPKSMVFFCNIVNHVKNAILNIMPFSKGKLPVKYLGVLFISSCLLNKDCKILIEQVKNRIGDWKNKSLSFAGRLQLCRSIEHEVLNLDSKWMERISKKKTKNEAKTTKPDTEWKNVKKTKSTFLTLNSFLSFKLQSSDCIDFPAQPRWGLTTREKSILLLFEKSQINGLEAATVGKPASTGRIQKNLLDRIVTIFLIESSIHIVDQNRYLVDTSLIHIESRKPPTAEMFDVDSGRISIVTVNTKEYHSDVLAIITRIMRRTLDNSL